MRRVLYLPAVNQSQAEAHYRRITRGEAPALEIYLSEGACRAHVSAFPPAFRESSRIWFVTERAGPDGLMVVAQDVAALPAKVLPFKRREG